ncbi:MAG: hypothetical protein ACOY3E_12400 [Pseudomonadota bacterium]
MPIVVRAFPIRRPLEELNAFAATLATERRAEADQFYRHYGVSHESWHLQQTPTGPWLIGVTRVDEPEVAAAQYAKAPEAFDAWFRAQVLHLSGIDPAVQPLGPPTTMIFSWSDSQRPQSNLCA